MSSITWDSKISAVAGTAAAKIEKAFGYRTVGELLSHYPRRYVDKGSVSDLEHLTLDEHITVVARVAKSTQRTYPDRRRGGMAYRLEVVVATEHDRLMLTFFDKKKHLADWRARTITEGSTGMFSGKVGRFRNDWQLTNPDTKIFGADDDAGIALAEFDAMPALLTIYPASSTVQSWQLDETITLALRMIDEVPDVLPDDVRRAHGLLASREALEWIHRPDSWEQKGAAEKRLRFDEAFVTQTALAQRRAALEALDATPRRGREGGLLDRFDERLPFTLTAGQQPVSVEVLDDLAAGHPMHRLLQGEVGSGKTVVALRAMLRVVDSGGQAALLAPTEVLAQQHDRSISCHARRPRRGRDARRCCRRHPGGPADRLARAHRPRKAALLDAAVGQRRHRHRHPRAARGRRAVRRPRPRRRRRAAPLRRRAARRAHREGRGHAAARAGDDGDADPAHGGDDGLRRPRDLDADRAARRARADPDHRRTAARPAGLDRPGLVPAA